MSEGYLSVIFNIIYYNYNHAGDYASTLFNGRVLGDLWR